MESKFLVSREGDPDKRSITHYHYTHWPDFGSPPTHSLVELVRRVGASKPEKPMVLHCSAGLGRSGVFATVHSSLECHMDKRHVDVKRTVEGLRRNREGMVQTQEQYRFCFQAIAEALLPAEKDKAEQTPVQPDSRPASYPPPPYREKEDISQAAVQPVEPTPPPPLTSPPPAFSEPTTPIKTPLVETPRSSGTPSHLPSAPPVEDKGQTPSRPTSGEREGVRRKVLEDSASSAIIEVKAEVERKESTKAEPKKVDPYKVEPKKVDPHKVEPKKVDPHKAEPKL